MDFGTNKTFITIISVVVLIFLIYFFSYQLQHFFARIGLKLSKKIGLYSTSSEYKLQRYIYQHSDSRVTKIYRWINEQLISLGLKRIGVTVVGYVIFWSIISFICGFIVCTFLDFGLSKLPVIFMLLLIACLIMSRVSVSGRLEKREYDIMNAIDLIVPEISNGVKNAIVTYKDNFPNTIRHEFLTFISNIQDRGYSFEDAMYILADSVGSVFWDFAQKAIYYEQAGEKDMIEIFTDITETNRLRRQLRDENKAAFSTMKTSFVASTSIVTGYFFFLVSTDDFFRNFFLVTEGGKWLLLAIIATVFAVLAYISTIRSRAI